MVIHVIGDKVLTKKLAEQFLENEDSNPLSEFTEIEDAAAAILAQHEGPLDLGVRCLSEVAAESLSKHRGTLYLDDLTSLSDEVAAQLSKHTGDEMHFGSLTSLSDNAAESLSHYTGWLNLESLTSLPGTLGHTRLAFQLGVMYGDANHDGRELDLSSLESLSDEAAIYLGDVKATLDLKSLKSVSDQVALSLSQHNGDLCLDGIRALSDTGAKLLSYHRGGSLSLNGLRTLSDTAAEWLGNLTRYLGLNGLTGLSDAAAESLSLHKGELGLCSLTTLSVSAAESLGRHQGSLSLSGLKILSEVAAKHLSKLKGHLRLDGITRLFDSAALNLIECPSCPPFACPACSVALSDADKQKLDSHYGYPCTVCKYNGFQSWHTEAYCIDLSGLTDLSDNAALHLSKTKRVLYVTLDNLPESAAANLRKHPSFSDED